MRALIWLSLSGAGLASLACRPPTLTDPLGRPVGRPILVASIDYGWIVIDTSAGGVRAVAEVTRMLPDSSSPVDRAIPLLRCSARTSAPARMRTEPVTCHQVSSGSNCARSGQANAPCTYPNTRFLQPCSQVVYLEYRLDAVPSVGDSLMVDLGDRVTRSRWARP